MEEAIELLERALEIQIRIGGASSPTVQKLSDHLCDMLNGCALKHLQNGVPSSPLRDEYSRHSCFLETNLIVKAAEELDEAFQLLQKAEVLSASNSVAAAVTFNNLACYYRRCLYLSDTSMRHNACT